MVSLRSVLSCSRIGLFPKQSLLYGVLTFDEGQLWYAGARLRNYENNEFRIGFTNIDVFEPP